MAEMGALALLGGGPDQAATLFCVIAYLGLSWLIARALRRPDLSGLAFGLLILTGAADLGLFILRDAAASTDAFLPLVLVLTIAITWVLRRWVVPPARPCDAALPVEWGLLAVVITAFWAVRIIQVDPSSGLSSQLGWTPLYLRSSFAAGRFLLPGDFQLGTGPAEFLFYSTDMLGLSALPGAFGLHRFYPAYLASSIAGTGVALSMLLSALRGRVAAQIIFVTLMVASTGLDPFFQTAVLRHWGDNVLMLGGALIMAELSRGAPWPETLRGAAAASVFLVFGRHYGAFFSAILMGGGGAVLLLKDRRATLAGWRGWLVLGGLLAAFSLREINYILHPTPYYPGGKLLTLVGTGWRYHVVGALHDWGLMTDGRVLLGGARSLWLLALVAVPVWLRQRGQSIALDRLLAPLVIMILPLLLHILTGYRSTPFSSKPYLLAIFFMAWYPAFVLTLLPQGWLEHVATRVLRWGGGLGVAGAAAWILLGPLAGLGPDRSLRWASDLYRSRNVDLNVANAAQAAGVDPIELSARPLMYFYCEPGMGLRNFVGGTLTADWDFWGEGARTLMAQSRDLGELVAKAGWPNLYLSSHARYNDFVNGGWERFQPELDAIEAQPWVERVVRFGDAKLVIVKRPSSKSNSD